MKQQMAILLIILSFFVLPIKANAKDAHSSLRNLPKPDSVRMELLNFSHLDSLQFTFRTPEGREFTSWAIYAEPVDKANPDGVYKPVEAPGEGYACVDDTARIAILYMDYYEKFKTPASLEKAKKALEFILYMNDGKGDFYNFIDKNGKINRQGETSKTGLDWWTARAFWAMGKGIRIFRDKDPEFSKKLEGVFLKTVALLENKRIHPEISRDIINQYKIRGISPGSLVNDSGAITSIYTLGLIEYYHTKQEPVIKNLIHTYCEAMMRMEETGEDSYPLTGFHYPTIWNTGMVHLYGNRQAMALAGAGKLFAKKLWILSAEREVNFAYPMLLTSWGVPFALSPGAEVYPQLAYSAETVISNLLAVYEATGREKFAVMAGLFSSWFFGDNPAKEVMYLAYKGRCFDGIDKNGANKNSGAESTLEALLAMTQIAGTPAAEYINMIQIPYYDRKPVVFPCRELNLKSGKGVKVTRQYEGGIKDEIICLDSPAELERNIRMPLADEYRAYLIYRKAGKDGTAPLKVRIAGRDKTVHLAGTDSPYQYKCVYLGRFDVRKQPLIQVEIGTEAQGNKIWLDSLVFLPSLQYSVWKRGSGGLINAINVVSNAKAGTFDGEPSFNPKSDTLESGEESEKAETYPQRFNNVLMIFNSSGKEQTIPVDFRKLEESAGKSFYTGDDVMKINLPVAGWVLFKL